MPCSQPGQLVTAAAACAVHAGGHPQIPGTGSYSLPLDEVLLSQMLKSKGYATHIVGKWCVAPLQRSAALLSQRAVLTHGCAWILRRHLGVYKWESTPSFRGFDSFYGYYHGAEDYFNRKNATRPAL
jgi:arylsulfatase A-like enzyme